MGKSIVGVDIGANGLRAVELRDATRPRPILLRHHEVPSLRTRTADEQSKTVGLLAQQSRYGKATTVHGQVDDITTVQPIVATGEILSCGHTRRLLNGDAHPCPARPVRPVPSRSPTGPRA